VLRCLCLCWDDAFALAEGFGCCECLISGYMYFMCDDS
jgi:hypothetical protein